MADSESSSVRMVDVGSGGTKALVGADRDPTVSVKQIPKRFERYLIKTFKNSDIPKVAIGKKNADSDNTCKQQGPLF